MGCFLIKTNIKTPCWIVWDWDKNHRKTQDSLRISYLFIIWFTLGIAKEGAYRAIRQGPVPDVTQWYSPGAPRAPCHAWGHPQNQGEGLCLPLLTPQQRWPQTQAAQVPDVKLTWEPPTRSLEHCRKHALSRGQALVSPTSSIDRAWPFTSDQGQAKTRNQNLLN